LSPCCPACCRAEPFNSDTTIVECLMSGHRVFLSHSLRVELGILQRTDSKSKMQYAKPSCLMGYARMVQDVPGYEDRLGAKIAYTAQAGCAWAVRVAGDGVVLVGGRESAADQIGLLCSAPCQRNRLGHRNQVLDLHQLLVGQQGIGCPVVHLPHEL
jgi:hypothetical protein